VKAAFVVVAALAALAGASSAAAAAQRCDPEAVEGQIMCPTCEGQTVDESPAPAAARIRVFIRKQSAAGDSCAEIQDKLVAEFGERIRAAPPKRGFGLLVWLLPLVGVGAGALVVGLLAWRWSRGRDERGRPTEAGPSGHAGLDPELERRLDEELARYD
jgi:cytochrome c-type biogenesis protein CcmH